MYNHISVTNCDRICENPALPANIDYALEAFIVTEVRFQQKRDYCMNGWIYRTLGYKTLGYKKLKSEA